ncbi:MAG TPA: mercury methylation ferredoxin HgcB [Syntrophomonadaceae bacterium]|nr:mercury methylation ferredoxin HgcB [Syntrophomonadaceae bacterium]
MKHLYLKNVATLELDSDKCNGCGLCLEVCPHEVFSLQGRVLQIDDRDACMECGACALNCPFDAIHVSSGVGCANAIIWSKIRGGEPSCDCGGCQC